LESLQMVAIVKPVDDFTCPRVAQLTQRSNQFNLRTKRYTEEDIRQVMADKSKTALAISLKDKFGDYGLISAVILEEKEDDILFIDTWIMSCRVLKRGVEALVLNEIAERARQLNRRFIVGEFLPTAKNGIVKDHYRQLGFQPEKSAERWMLDLNTFEPQTTLIHKKELYAID
jgi:FkbH-like protein